MSFNMEIGFPLTVVVIVLSQFTASNDYFENRHIEYKMSFIKLIFIF